MDLLNMNLPAQISSRVWSPLQEAIYSAVRETSDNLLVNAKAGSGKTTTLIEVTNWSQTPTAYLAFAKANALDLQKKLSDPKMARTLNSMGHGLWMRNAPGAQFDIDKLEKIVSRVVDDLEKRKRWGYLVKRLVSTAKYSGVGLDAPPDTESFVHFITNGDWDIDTPDVSEVAEYCLRAFMLSVSDMGSFDFDDQVFGPCFHKWRFPRLATVLVDEAQDLNHIQHVFVERLVMAGARLIAVGDPNQAIFAFRGALNDSLDRMKRQFSMLELPLSVCYRCPQAVIREAQMLVPDIEARPGAPEGQVLNQLAEWEKLIEGAENRHELQPEDPVLFGEDWLVICRNNAPLFACVMRHVRARRPCRVLSNTLTGLASFIRRLKPKDCDDLEFKVHKWMEKEVLAAEAKGMPWKAAVIQDKAYTVIELARGCAAIHEVLDLLVQLSEGKSGPIFATIHKAKGLEAKHVYFLRPDLVPSAWCEKPEELQQEMNLRYVGITRAQETLTWGLSQRRK